MVGMDDKRQLTILLGVTLFHPNVNLPCDWHVTHSENHWSTRETMLKYIDQILSPHIMIKQREESGLEEDTFGLCNFDAVVARKCEDILQSLHKRTSRMFLSQPMHRSTATTMCPLHSNARTLLN